MESAKEDDGPAVAGGMGISPQDTVLSTHIKNHQQKVHRNTVWARQCVQLDFLLDPENTQTPNRILCLQTKIWPLQIQIVFSELGKKKSKLQIDIEFSSLKFYTYLKILKLCCLYVIKSGSINHLNAPRLT